MEVIVIVDPISTGARMAEVASSRGFRVVSLWSKECTPQIRGALAGIRDGYEAVEEQASIAATVEAIQDQLRRTSPSSATVLSACIPGSEPGVQLADLISLHLGLLPHGSGNATFAGGDRRNKHVQQKALEKSGLRAVREVCGSKWQDVKDFLGDLGLPMVVKPVQSAGTEGVKLCQSLEEAEEHFTHLHAMQRKFVSDTTILCQEFLAGQEYAVDHVSRNGVHKTVMTWVYEKKALNGSTFVYLATRPLETKECPPEMISYTRAVLDALQVRNGATHAEVKMTPDGPCLVEVNMRMMGANGAFISLARLLTGTSQVDATLDSLNQKRFDALPDVPRAFGTSGLMVSLVSYSAGTVTSTPGYERMKKLATFLELHTSISCGSAVAMTVDVFTIPGLLVLAGSNDQIRADVAEVRRLEEEGLFCFADEAKTFTFGGA
ncbi:Dapdiamide A synthase (ATP-dependent N-fumaramoyl-DAP-amino acid ligase) [Durusdinium trenchii]|uniref:Dapdiamide A synthase (ATP-dependent N-fumaramoyl-DAP-amino acid ligase) n=1 Tax=Durusdinium trenchii TaxID=1381693 RepID=A0ABP0QUG0_9DINO